MNLLFDLTTIQHSKDVKFYGGGLYGEIVFFALLKKSRSFTGIYDSMLYMNPKIAESGITLYDINKISINEVVKKENIDVFFLSGDYKYNFHIHVKRCIIVWHGPRFLEMPYDNVVVDYSVTNFKMLAKPFIRSYFKKKQRKMKLFYERQANLENAEYITVSEHSKHSIISFCPHLAKKDIPVFYSPLNDEQIELPQPKFESGSYFLLTSAARWIKNNLRALWAFDELFSQRKDLDFKVVLAGVVDEKIFAKNLKNREKFIFVGYVERAELLSLHKNAYAFIYPSLNEGFGYPPVESMMYGVPVAASGTSSIPEICQNGAIYFDPYNVSEIKNRIIQLLDKDIYGEYSARAVERYKIVSERQKLDLEKIVDFILKENGGKK